MCLEIILRSLMTGYLSKSKYNAHEEVSAQRIQSQCALWPEGRRCSVSQVQRPRQLMPNNQGLR